jgi:hypothetical protein
MNYGGPTGAYDNVGQVVLNQATLKTYSGLRGGVHHVNNNEYYRIINLSVPQGMILREILIKQEGRIVPESAGSRFYLPDSERLRTLFGKSTTGPDESFFHKEVIFEFVEAGQSSVKKADHLQYVNEEKYKLDLIKRFIQTYSDKEGLYLENHGDDRIPKNFSDNKPYPSSFKIVSYNNIPYLFVNARAQILVFDISNPTSPSLVAKMLANELPAIKDLLSSSSTKINHSTGSGWPSFIDMEVADNSPYIVVSAFVGGLWAINRFYSIAVLEFNPVSKTLRAVNNSTSFSLYSFHGSQERVLGSYSYNGKDYFLIIANLEPEDRLGKETLGIFSLDKNGNLTLESNLNNFANSNFATEINVDLALRTKMCFDLSTINQKPYLIVAKNCGYGAAGSKKVLYIYDISDPKNPSLVSNLENVSKILGFDRKNLNLYVLSDSSIILSSISIYNLSDPSSPKLIKGPLSFSDFISKFLKISSDSSQIKEFQKRLKLDGIPLEFMVSTTDAHFWFDEGVVSFYGWIDHRSNKDWPSGGTEDSDYFEWLQFFVDVNDISNPKIILAVSSRSIPFSSTGSSEHSVEYDAATWELADVQNPFVIYQNRYLYRAAYRTADIWGPGTVGSASSNQQTSSSTSSSFSPSTNSLQTQTQDLRSALSRLYNMFRYIQNALRNRAQSE